MASNWFIIVYVMLVYSMHIYGLIKTAPHQESIITKLPGYHEQLPSKHYSGYVGIGEKQRKQLFYYFVESQSNPAEDPVVLWLNGGPGCSSMLGFVDEHGPFTFELSTIQGGLPSLYLNPYSWSKVSNIIYLDSPVGVGFSFSQNKSDYDNTSDLKIASDTHHFLIKWFEIFPEYNNNPFYIRGESYAGVYVPTLASEIIKGQDSDMNSTINLKGYLIGNGVTNDQFDDEAQYPYAHGMGLIPDDLYQGILDACHGNYSRTSTGPECESKLETFDNITNGLNQYDILSPCYKLFDPNNRCISCVQEPTGNNNNGTISVRMKNRPLYVKRNVFRDQETGSNSISVDINITRLCEEDMISDRWLNNEGVREAIHAAEEGVSGKWEACRFLKQYKKDAGSVIKYHETLTSLGLRVLIYSGDLDMIVPYTGSQAWTKSLGYKIIDEWRSWVSNEQVAGFVQGYDKNLTFLIVKGAGHMVPASKPRESLDFYSRWLVGKSI